MPSDAEAAAFYEANKERIPIPKEQALPQVKQYLAAQSRNRYRDALITRLKKQYGFKSYLEPLRTKIGTGITGRCAETGESLLIHDAANCEFGSRIPGTPIIEESLQRYSHHRRKGFH